MVEPGALREHHRQRTHRTISDAAITLFLERGFDQVSVMDIAAAAEVSKPTVFKYFPTKEDLVVHRYTDYKTMVDTAVRKRQPGMSPLAALHQEFLRCLARRAPVTGLNDQARIVRMHGLVYSTPSLQGRAAQYLTQAEDVLAQVLHQAAGTGHRDIGTHLLACQVIASGRVLAYANWQRILSGHTAEEVSADAVADANLAFSRLQAGLAATAAESAD
ncbi:TetR family transcriptional regulator [Streptomyces lacrimifluminis]|uniref:TetR family transcriptional regulator n=1 Tax=Streptomyces lacrimifluminis TaxID=1500077 RepID=A0A917PD42_9ACTN|nr:TetR family transcriptional regulator [Streptomyces lacrimifluminis]GGJ71218.1 TetR family transcriptional regulator [Streptomyces lacrimifluminis]